MKDQDKTKEQLIKELAELRQRAAELEAADTERKQAEEDLDRIFNLSPDMICISGFDGYVRRLNPAFEKTLGYTNEEILARPFLDFVHPEDRAVTIAKLQELAAGIPTVYFEQRCRCKDGSYKWLAWANAPVVEEGLMYAVAHDITERKRAEDALRESEDRYIDLYDNAPDMYFTVRRDGTVLSVNRLGAEMLGYQKEELIGKSVTIVFHPDDVASVQRQIDEILKIEEGISKLEFRKTRKDGSVMYVSERVSLQYDPQGEPILRIICRDVTERKRAEEEIRRRNRELAALNAITATMMRSALDLDEVLQRVADGVVEGLGCNTAAILLLDEKEGVFKGSAVSTKAKILERINAVIGFPLIQIKFPARSDFNEAMSNALGGRITIKHDLYELVGPIWSKPVCYAMQRLLDSRTFFTMPLLAKGKTVGGIIASTREELGEGDTEKLMTFANQAAIAIENAQLYQETQQRALEQETLREAALVLTTALDRDEVIERILAQLRQVVPYDSASVQLLQGDRLVIIGGHGFPNLDELLGISFPVDGDHPNQEVMRTLSPFIVEDAPTVYEAFREDPHRQTVIRSWLGVPMLIGEQSVGMIALDKREPGFYTQEHARLAEAFAAQGAIAIENARLFEQLEERQVYLEGVLGAAPDAIVTLDDRFQVVEWNAGAERLFGYSREEAVGQHLDHLVTNPDVFEEAIGFTQRVLGGKGLPPTETVRYRKDGSPVDVILAGSPIMVGDELIGVVAVYTDITARVRMEETLRALALLDELTGLYNRRGFLTLGQQQLKTANRTKSRMVLLFADFNGLKRINDTFGHPEGDRALIAVADVLRETFRESDIIARIAGDEFVVLAIETNETPAEILITRLQENLEVRNAREGRRYELSLSVGLARYDPEHPCSIDELVAQADRAMYERKRGDQKA